MASASATNKKVESDDGPSSNWESSDDSTAVRQLARGKTNMRYPGIKENANTGRLYRMEKEQSADKGSQWVTVRLQAMQMRMLAGTGSCYILIPLELYREEIRKLGLDKSTLRRQGILNVYELFCPEVTTKKDTKCKILV